MISNTVTPSRAKGGRGPLKSPSFAPGDSLAALGMTGPRRSVVENLNSKTNMKNSLRSHVVGGIVDPGSRHQRCRLQLFAAALTLLPVIASAKINVVATLPDLGSLARDIGGDNVEVTVLAKPTEDPHFVDARPSFVVALRSADLLIDGGAELEIGWLPPLLQNARNPKIETGKPGRVVASQGVRLMNVPTTVTRAAGDVHVLGNPHFITDPIIAKTVAQHIAQAFSTLDSANAAKYDANYKKFEATINAKLQEWGAAMLPFKGQAVVAYHDSWPYFAHRFGIGIDLFLEPKPGIPASPSHLP